MSLANSLADTDKENEKKLPGVDDIVAKYAQLSTAIEKMQISLNTLRSDMDRIKSSQNEKISRAIFAELENRVNAHGKGLESTSRKLCELNGNLTTFTSQPISFQVIESIQKHLEEIITKEVLTMIESRNDELKKLIEDKNTETRNIIMNAKRALYFNK